MNWIQLSNYIYYFFLFLIKSLGNTILCIISPWLILQQEVYTFWSPLFISPNLQSAPTLSLQTTNLFCFYEFSFQNWHKIKIIWHMSFPDIFTYHTLNSSMLSQLSTFSSFYGQIIFYYMNMPHFCFSCLFIDRL